MAQPSNKTSGRLVEILDQGRLRPGLIVREQGERVALLGADGREKLVSRDLVLVHHTARSVDAANLPAVLAELEADRSRMAAELDLKLLWEVVREQGGTYKAEELAELFFGQRSALGTTVVLDALLNDRLYFIRRHLEFVPNPADRVERIRLQQERTRLRSDESRRIQGLIRDVLINHQEVAADQAGPLVEQLGKYLDNPSTRGNDLTAMLTAAAPDLAPAEAAYEVMERLEAPLRAPRYVLIGGIRTEFSAAAMQEAANANPLPHPQADTLFSVSIDDEETVEIDDALSCAPLPGGGLRVLIHIALVADWVARNGAIDREAAARAATVYLPEGTVRMLPDPISCERASLIAGQQRVVLTTDVSLGPDGTVLQYKIYPSTIAVNTRLTYTEADALIAGSDADRSEGAQSLKLLHSMALALREWRRRAGAVLIRRRESKVRVQHDCIDISVIDSDSPSRITVAEYMILSNHLAAQFCAANAVPIIYRVQPGTGGDLAAQHPRLSLFPGLHAGVGLEFYAQLSSPIRRYADLVLQRQLLGFLVKSSLPQYQTEELLTVLANAESADGELRELERRSKRYWSLRYLERVGFDQLLPAAALREGNTAELLDYAVRGTLRGAPNLGNESRILVRLASVDPLRGWLAMQYVGPAPAAAPLAPATGA
ncbi:MAG TPA: ribonuclease catalytic domain-containing protein [Candidatus Binataceae bacterium]|nr:ribonuclease catalytic domain-containing protein [Candidatus Binataceae bacterium]